MNHTLQIWHSKWGAFKALAAALALMPLAMLLGHSGAVQAQPVAVFTHEVDVLDEFLDRFNNRDSLMFQAYSNSKNKSFSESRSFLIRSLFDFTSKNWKGDDVKTFIKKVNEDATPQYLDFADKDWYAELVCSMTYKGKPEKLSLILQFEELPSGVSQWLIVGAKAPWLAAYADTSSKIPMYVDPKKGLNPSSHGNDFISVYRAFDDMPNIRSYMRKDALPQDLQKLLRGFVKKQTTLVQVDRVTYHFMQVDGWLFTVKNFPHRKTNAGWLISELLPADAAIKKQYKAKILNLN